MSILTEILAHKRVEVAALDVPALRRAAAAAPAPRDLCAALGPSGAPGRGATVKLIAELKRASPSRGEFAPSIDLLQVAETYAANGAAAVSVLTDGRYFRGSLQTLSELRFGRGLPLPLLRKDFIIDAVQLYEARAAGADAVLLIAAALPDDALFADLHALALELGLTPLVEVHDEAEAARALAVPGLRLIGINNRDLTTFAVSLATTERLRPRLPADVIVVSESGIFSAPDVERVARAGVQAILVGEALITAPDLASRVRELSRVSLRASSAEPR
jgi:indole-3-glycerol phosphate synthase